MNADASGVVEPTWLSAAVGMTALAACLASLTVAIRWLRRWWRREPLVGLTGFAAVPPVCWDGFDVLVVSGLFILTQAAAQQAASWASEKMGFDAQDLGPRLLAGGCGMLLFSGATVGLLRTRGAGWSMLGLIGPAPTRVLGIAAETLLLILAPLLAVAAALDRVVPYRHPVVDYLGEHRDGWAVGVVIFSAVIAAPVAEELLFRGVLQGWLRQRIGGWGVPLSALAFGLAHMGHGLGWVPLVGFGLATGFVASQTGSILPGMLVHGLFNAVSVGLLLMPRDAG
jgi:membrane protease YdiL (CAAX protease family)